MTDLGWAVLENIVTICAIAAVIIAIYALGGLWGFWSLVLVADLNNGVHRKA